MFFNLTMESIALELINSSVGAISINNETEINMNLLAYSDDVDTIEKYLDEVKQITFYLQTMEQRIDININENKTNKMRVNRRRDCDLPISIDGMKLEEVEQFK